MKTHDCTASDIQRDFERLKAIMEEDNRVPNKIKYPKIDLREHEKIMDAQAMRKELFALKSEFSTLESNLQTVKQELSDSENRVKNLKCRGLISRIFNRRV